jgi:glycerol-3-phosphate acyltransferase PlsY
MIIYNLLESIIAFLLGSIPFGIIICHQMGLASPTTYGSKNIGASNVTRQNVFAGALTFLLDAAKGFIAIKLLSANPNIIFFVTAGHCYSPFLKFNGGKGVATLGGALIAALPPVAAVLMSIWAAVFSRNKVPATASLAVAFILLIYAAIGSNIWLVLSSLMIMIRHKSNVTASQKA